MTTSTRWLSCLLMLVSPWVRYTQAQPYHSHNLTSTSINTEKPPTLISLNHIPTDGFLLKEGWRFQAGDNPDGASPQLNDRQWRSIDPTKTLRDLPQLRQAGIGWLRLHLHTGPELPPLMIKVFQSVASEIYLDGRLLYRFGIVSAYPDQVKAYDPRATFSLPLQPSSEHVLALRIACQPGLYYNIRSQNWHTDAIEYWLFSSSSTPTLKPYDTEQIGTSAFKVGIAFILFILHLSLFLAYRTTQRTNLYAAGMYLMLCITFLARAADNYTHSLYDRLIIHYASLIDFWVPAMALLTFYSLFDFRKGWLCWLAIGSISFSFITASDSFYWLSWFDRLILFEFIRLSLMATQRNLLGARIVTVGAFFNLGLWVTILILTALHITAADHEWLINFFYVVSFLCFPLTLSLRLALEHGWVNRQLRAQLDEVELLSARNLVQQQERQQLLAQQNERLEQQVTERTQELHQQASQLRQLDQVKSRFVTNMTHEFRTPLSLIISPVEKLLQENRFDRPLLTLIQRNARQLLRLVNQLLDLSKLEGNHMAVSLMQGELTSFIYPIVDVFQRAAEQKHVTLTCIVGQFPPQPQVFDSDKWEKILTNLLANALKFTPTGGQISLTINPVWEVGEGRRVQIQLTDSGIGIAPDQLPHIFNRFYQVDTSSTRAYGGTGIGLALVKELIDLLEGTITVESEPGVGTTFRLTLPLQFVSTSLDLPAINDSVVKPSADWEWSLASPAPVTIPSGKESFRAQILLIEDNDELRGFLVNELSGLYHVLQAADGETGWSLIQSELPDIVITDVMMARLDGYALAHLVKSHAHTDHIAVVILTAKAAQENRLTGLEQGADDYLTKPFSMGELLLRIQNLLSRQRRLQERVQASLTSIRPAEEPPEMPANPFLVQLYQVLGNQFSNPAFSVEELADKMALSRKQLTRKVKTLTGLSTSELLRNYRLQQATTYLRQGLSSSETAYQVGFESPAYFTKCFREVYGRTPIEFTRQTNL
ncbi:ATP-binding protein [Spirosoma validum]|uniref:histidine kinase n=1 Tax=Spirosoma validum TaxID=2771355 RepID=A0A927GDW5_9BACT|nr:ATP-binding protein [Spirosoma validum]MBD2753985.1 response regulator [Spirosoma validum]